jgi:hypothetical protein
MTRLLPHEPGAELLTPEDVDSDIATLAEALLEKRAERIARNVLLRPDIRDALEQLLATRLYASEEEVIVRSLKALQLAVVPSIATTEAAGSLKRQRPRSSP